MTHPIMIGKRLDPNAPRPPLRERIAALRLVPRLIRLVWETQPTYTVLMILLRLTRSVVPVTNLWVAKLIIDEVVMLARTHGPTQHLWVLVAIEMGAIVVGELLARTSGMIEGLLGDMFTNRISIRIMEHAATLDLHQFEWALLPPVALFALWEFGKFIARRRHSSHPGEAAPASPASSSGAPG